MLARRFTIVCLVTAVFGMAFATLVAQARLDDRSFNADRPSMPSCLAC